MFFYRASPPLTSGRRPPTAIGPTISQPISERPPDSQLASEQSATSLVPTFSATVPTISTNPSPLVPFKQQRPFCSGSPGVTTWYTTSSTDDIVSPPPELIAEVGELYVHHNRVSDIYHVWLYAIDHRWKCVTTQEKVYHPAIDDRVLSMRANGTPNWITAASFTTIRGRKGKGKQV